MPYATWEDETSYSNGDKQRIPNTWMLKLPWIILCVHRHIHYEPDQWLLGCAQLGIDKHELEAKDIKDAQAEALKYATAMCQNYLTSLKKARP